MKQINKRIIRFFEMLADETRLRILLAIDKGPVTVNKIHSEVDYLTLSAISHQLNAMASYNMVNVERKGRERYYSLSEEYCWCPLRDAISKMSKQTQCPHCAEIIRIGGRLI